MSLSGRGGQEIIKLTAIILTYNEEIHIERAIRSAQSISANVVLVDSFSSDGTIEIAKRLGATVIQRTFRNQAEQLQWALDNIRIETPWVMRLDADEYLLPALAREIAETLGSVPKEVSGIYLRRRHIFMGRVIRHGGRYPLRLLRIWRNGAGYVEPRWMDEHIVICYGTSISLRNDFCDHNLRGLDFFVQKHSQYATREAIEVISARYSLFDDRKLELRRLHAVVRIKRAIKDAIYNKMPFPSGPLAYFVFRYFFQIGFLDGWEGFSYHFLQGLWYRMLVGIKVKEFESCVGSAGTREEKIRRLEEASGLSLRV